MGVKAELDMAKKELEVAKKDLEGIKGTIDAALKANETALKSYEDKKKTAGGGLKKLGTLMDALKKLAEKAPFNQNEAIKLIQQANAAADEAEKATVTE